MSVLKKTIYFISVSLLFIHQESKAQINVDTIDRHWGNYISLEEYLVPFTQADTIINEIILPIQVEKHRPSANLLFPVKEILSVRSVYLDKTFLQLEDWDVKGRQLTLTHNSNIPFLKEDELLFKEAKTGFSLRSKQEGYHVLFNEGQLFPSYQLAVTYIADRTSDISFPKLISKRGTLKRTVKKLQNGVPLQVVFYGNSIEVGGNSSGFLNVSPFMPNWTELVIYNLRQHYSSTITYKNSSVGGMTAKWGQENADERVSSEHPDLVVIAFGMNDGTSKVPIPDFIQQLKGIMDTVRQKNPKCEFILVTPMLANPLAIHSQIQADYRLPIFELKQVGVAIADVTLWHDWLLKHKSYQDMTGNNINHPNDYLARWYAHIVSELLIKEKNIL